MILNRLFGQIYVEILWGYIVIFISRNAAKAQQQCNKHSASDGHSHTHKLTRGHLEPKRGSNRIESDRIGSRCFCYFGAAAPAKWFVARFTTDLPAWLCFCRLLFAVQLLLLLLLLWLLALAIALAEIGDRRSLLAPPLPPPPPFHLPSLPQRSAFSILRSVHLLAIHSSPTSESTRERQAQVSPNNRNRTQSESESESGEKQYPNFGAGQAALRSVLFIEPKNLIIFKIGNFFIGIYL